MDNNRLLALSQTSIFSGVEILELQKLLSKYDPIIKKYKKNEIIHIQETEFDRLIIVLDGKLKARMDSEDGKTIGMEDFKQYQCVAIPILSSPKRILPVTLFALEDSEVFILKRDTLIDCSMKNRVILENILSNMSGRVSYLTGKIKFLQLNPIKQKIAFMLLKNSKAAGSKSFILSVTKEELAKEMGVTRPSLSREFANLVKEGIISQDKNNITIIKPALLKEYK